MLGATRPPAVRRGATVAVTHSAGPCAPDVLAEGLLRLRDAGLRVVRRAPSRSGPAWLAASDDERLFGLGEALGHPDASAILEARGGFGTTRLLDRIPRGLLASRPRWLVGYSDVTALHLWVSREGVASIHGPMVAGYCRHNEVAGDSSVKELLDLLANPTAERVWHGLERVAGGQARGIATGGNLSLLAAMIGTRELPDWHDRIVFIEEIGEAPYRIDRMLTSLFAHGRATGLRGVVLGQFTRCGEGDEGEQAARARLVELLAGYGIPVLAGGDFGHGTPNRPFLLGVPVAIDADAGRVTWPAAQTQAPALRPRPEPDVDALIADALDRNLCSALQLDVRVAGELVLSRAAGFTRGDRGPGSAPVSATTRFDVASLTKAVSTALLAWRAIERGALSLEDTLPPDLGVGEPSLRDLLRHTAGYLAHIEAFRAAREAGDPLLAARAAFASVPRSATTPVYSDVGYIALGRWLERVLGAPLDTLFGEYVAKPLGLATVGWSDGREPLVGPAQVAATEFCPWRSRVLQGIVHDENCQVLGGVAGHAGLFASAADIGAIAQSLLGFGQSVLAPNTVDAMWSRGLLVEGGTYVGGWDTPSGALSTAGTRVRRDTTFGHLGFTGTSVWIDRSRAISIVLLTNRVHVSRASDLIRGLRPAIHDAVMDAVFGAPAPESPA